MKLRPQKAPTEPLPNCELGTLIYPVIGSPKVDGYRCLVDGVAKTSTLKPIPNRYVSTTLSIPALDGLDGELVVGAFNDPNVFNNTTGPLRRFEGEPDFTYYVFDDFRTPTNYTERWLKRLPYLPQHCRVRPMPHVVLHDIDALKEYELKCIEEGFEGIMVRDPYGMYKYGRATFREMNIFKRKPMVDTEAVIVGFEEQLENTNEKTTNELGFSKRSRLKENMVPTNTLGAFVVVSGEWEDCYHVSTGVGLTDALRKQIWDNRDAYLNQVIVVKYQQHGSLEAPRLPIFKGFRPDWDIEKK